jgi:hypothetical protein
MSGLVGQTTKRSENRLMLISVVGEGKYLNLSTMVIYLLLLEDKCQEYPNGTEFLQSLTVHWVDVK